MITYYIGTKDHKAILKTSVVEPTSAIYIIYNQLIPPCCEAYVFLLIGC